MAKVYASARAQYGNLTGQIIIWPIEVNPDINSNSNKKVLPSGYLRCDGTIYNVIDYPRLAEICGVGKTGKFVRRDIKNNPLQELTDEQFVVPDLGSKYPKPTTGPDAGQYKSIRTVSQAGIELSRSGIGIEATSTLGTTIELTYSGFFTVPSQEIELKGKPVWTIGVPAGKQTDSETVDELSIAGHFHFFQGVRARLKSTSEVDEASPTTPLDPQAFGSVAFWNASTVPIQNWMDYTKAPGTGFPGNNQPPCRAMASNRVAVDYEYQFGAFSGAGGDPNVYSNACYNGGTLNLEDQWMFQCLLNVSWSGYPISDGNYRLNSLTPEVESGTLALGICTTGLDINDGPFQTSKNVNAFYVNGGTGVPEDWRDLSLYDVVPLNSNIGAAGASSLIYPSLFNEFTETAQLVQEDGDPTLHFHKLEIEKDDHQFKIKTDALQITPDALKTTLNLSVDQAASVDSVSSPYIILEYLIKI